MHAELRQVYEKEMHAAAEHYYGGNPDKAFYHLERAHILGQSFAFTHARAHWWMLKVGLETPRLHRDTRASCQDDRGVDVLKNLGAIGEYRRCAC